MKITQIPSFIRTLSLDGLSNKDKFMLIAKKLEPKFEINDSNRSMYDQLNYYFSKNKQFNGNLEKGLLLIGSFGTGKSLAMQLYQLHNYAVGCGRYFQMYDTDEIITSFTKFGRPSIEGYNGEHDIAIDELGEDSGRHYHFGTVEDPIDLLVGRRYKRFKEKGILTHATSNLDAEQLKLRFSGKVYDRMCEMFNVIPVVGESWRLK